MTVVPLTGPEWIAAYARRLGLDVPTQSTIEDVLALAATAAHASERMAAPIACWLAGRAGVGLEAAVAVANSVSDTAV